MLSLALVAHLVAAHCVVAPCAAADAIRATDRPPRQIVVRLSGELFAPLIERPIDEVQAVDEEVFGARTLGQAHVSGHPQLTLVDDPAAACFRVTVTGKIVSRTVGRKGPVQIHGQSETRFTASKRVVFQPGRGFVAEPAEIAAQTSSQTDAVESDRRGVLGRAIERRAWKRVAQNRQQVNQIVQAKAEAKIREAFDRLLDARLAGLNRHADQRYLIAAVLGGEDKPHYRCSTQGSSLIIVASLGPAADRDQAAVDAIARRQAGAPMQVWVHEGVIGDRLSILLRQVDLARRLMPLRPAAVIAPTVPVPGAHAPQTTSRLSYDFAAIGDWFVVHSGDWSFAAATTTAAPTATATLADRPAATTLQPVGLARPAGSGGGQ